MLVGVVDDKSHEVGVLVGQLQEDFLFVVLAVATAAMDLYADGEWQADNGRDIAGRFQPLQSAHS